MPVGRWPDRRSPRALMTADGVLAIAVLLGWAERVAHRLGPARIAGRLRLPRWTVHRSWCATAYPG